VGGGGLGVGIIDRHSGNIVEHMGGKCMSHNKRISRGDLEIKQAHHALQTY
jgi:hypothetical protein